MIILSCAKLSIRLTTVCINFIKSTVYFIQQRVRRCTFSYLYLIQLNITLLYLFIFLGLECLFVFVLIFIIIRNLQFNKVSIKSISSWKRTKKNDKTEKHFHRSLIWLIWIFWKNFNEKKKIENGSDMSEMNSN